MVHELQGADLFRWFQRRVDDVEPFRRRTIVRIGPSHHNAPRDLAVRIDKLSSTHAPLALFATVDALVQRGYRRIEWRVLEPTDAALAEATGFSLEGDLRKYCIEDGCSRDARLYSVLNTDWRERRPVVAARLGVVETDLKAAWTLKDCCAPAPRKKNT